MMSVEYTEGLTVYDSWDLSQPSIPVRSRLFQLEPISLGTFYGESLTSYISRLAEIHGLSTGILMTRIVAPLSDKHYINQGVKKGLRELFNCATALNGHGIMANELADIISKLTEYNQLNRLTLQSFANLFPTRGLQRSYKAWCPYCYQQWYQNKDVLYEPLIWTVESVKVCPLHHQWLQIKCPSCQQTQSWLTWNSRPGMCSNCHSYLGIELSNTQIDRPDVSSPEFQRLLWNANSVGGLIASSATSTFLLNKEIISTSVQKIIRITHQGNISAFAKSMNLPKNTVWMWVKGKALPQLEMLLRICHVINISLVEFFNISHSELEKSSLGIKFQVQNVNFAKRQKRISPKKVNLIQLQKSLQEILNDTVNPPLTLQVVATQLGHDRRIIYSYFPELCRQITAKYRSYLSSLRDNKIETACQEVKHIVMELFSQGKYPSESLVSGRMSQPGYFRYKKVRGTLTEVRRSLRIEP